ncbi:unnamed protein product [Mytilus edulis]|uniref:B box-type domain-containing protein n=1 Tax=Mytilus edulis TaxID=6550 RepID=A0A8S3QCT4_MYTED|nr:unnamed protein product [Mytilus edulis]
MHTLKAKRDITTTHIYFPNNHHDVDFKPATLKYKDKEEKESVGEMATETQEIICGPCDFREISKPAVVWCPTCDEGLCDECSGHHSAAKATRGHKLINSNHYKGMPRIMIEELNKCLEHDENQQLSSLLSKDCSLATVKTSNSTLECDLKIFDNLEAQKLSTTVRTTVSKLKLKQYVQIDRWSTNFVFSDFINITSIVPLPSGQTVMTDYGVRRFCATAFVRT